MKKNQGQEIKAELSEIAAPKVKDKPSADVVKSPENAAQKPTKPLVKLTYKDQRELNNLPSKIENAEAEIAALSEALSQPGFFKEDPKGFHKATCELSDAQAKLERYESRWLELEEMQNPQ